MAISAGCCGVMMAASTGPAYQTRGSRTHTFG
jgi:hypothetical protein